MKKLAAALAITGLIFLVEIAGGFISNSLALLSDAVHMLTDILALTLALAAMYFSTRPATAKKTYGFYRLEILSALLNGSFLVLIALFIFYEAYQRFLHPAPVQSGLMLGVALIGLAANLFGASLLADGAHGNLNMRGAFLHVLSDAISSLGVVAGAVIIHFTGWSAVDPVLGVLIGLLVLRGAMMLVIEAANILLEAAPKGVELEAVVAEIKKFKGVKELHDVHIWTIASGMNAISAHLLVEDEMADRTAKVLEEIKEMLEKKYAISHSTFQTECASCPEGIICKIGPKEVEHHH